MSEYPIPEELKWQYETDLGHEVNGYIRPLIERIARLEAQNKALIEALDHYLALHVEGCPCIHCKQARAAIAQAKEPPCSTP